MTTEPQGSPGSTGTDDLFNLRPVGGFLLALGIVFIVLGMLAIAFSFVATMAITLTFGILLAVGGVLQVVTSFLAGPWSGRLLHLALGILYAIVGAFMIRHPITAVAGITLVLAAVYMAGGLIRIAYAVSHRAPGAGWVLLNGVITFILGLLVWVNWPWDVWVIGLFVGIDMLFVGWSWVMLGSAVRVHSKIGPPP